MILSASRCHVHHIKSTIRTLFHQNPSGSSSGKHSAFKIERIRWITGLLLQGHVVMGIYLKKRKSTGAIRFSMRLIICTIFISLPPRHDSLSLRRCARLRSHICSSFSEGLLCISWASTVAFKVNPPNQQPWENVFHLRISLFEMVGLESPRKITRAKETLKDSLWVNDYIDWISEPRISTLVLFFYPSAAAFFRVKIIWVWCGLKTVIEQSFVTD